MNTASKKNLYDLAQEALKVQDACNLSGVVRTWAVCRLAGPARSTYRRRTRRSHATPAHVGSRTMFVCGSSGVRKC